MLLTAKLTCWLGIGFWGNNAANSHLSHTVSSTPCHGAWTPAPLSAHLSIECNCTAPQIETPICTRRTTHSTGRLTNRMRRGRTTLQDSALSSPTPAPNPSEWPSQEVPGSGLTASAPMSDVSATACTNEVWRPLRPVSVAQKNKPSIMLSYNV